MTRNNLSESRPVAQQHRSRKAQRQPRRHSTLLETLEPRTLLSVVIAASAKTATYIDLDDDLITIAISKGTLTAGMFTTNASGPEDQLQKIDFSAGGFDGANLTITAQRKTTGDGMANIGFIDSTGHDLGTVTINGDLGRINAGDTNGLTPALATLSVNSMGRFGLDTQATTGTLTSIIRGALSKLSVKGDIKAAAINVFGVATTSEGIIGSVIIGGSLIGGDSTYAGQVTATGSIGTVKIGGDILGGNGGSSGLLAAGNIGDLTIGGSVQGGSVNAVSGFVSSDTSIGNINLHGSLIGGIAYNSGGIRAGGSIKSLTIGGSIVGGVGNTSNSYSGVVLVTHDIGPVKVAGDVVGGSLNSSGVIQSDMGNIASITVGGSLIGSTADTSGAFITTTGILGTVKIGHDINAGVVVGHAGIKSITVVGSLIGGALSGKGQILAPAGDLTLLKIGGNIVGGSQIYCGIVQGATIGAITVAGSVIGGSWDNTAVISSASGMNSVKIGGDLHGGAVFNTGEIIANAGAIATLTVGGSVIGGSAELTGFIYSKNGDLGNIKIGGNLIGGNSDSTNAVIAESGAIYGTHIQSVNIAGSVIAGVLTNGAKYYLSAAIYGQTLGSVFIGGSLVGNSTAAVNISAVGNANSHATPDIVAKTITIKGRVEYAQMYFGYILVAGGNDADAQVGTVTVGGDWIASSLIAGINPGADKQVGTIDDVKISGLGVRDDAPLSRIDSITISGQILGTPRSINALDSFGFEAEEIGAFTANGLTYKLTAAPHTDFTNFPGTGDVSFREL